MARGRRGSLPKEIKRGNGTGSVYKLNDKPRRKPWTVQVSSGTIKKPDGSYHIKRQRLGYYATREEAVLALARYTESPYKLHDSYLFSEVYEMWSQKYFPTINTSSERTIVSAYNHCQSLWVRVFSTISIQDMRDTIEDSGNSPSLQSKMKSLLNLMYDFAVEAEIVEVNKARQFTIKGLDKSVKKNKKDKKPISYSHIKALESDCEYGYTRMILIGIYTGMRPSEICTLHRCNIHLDENYMIGGMKTEAGENRCIPIHPKIKDYIAYYYNRTTEEDTYLIQAEDGQIDSLMTYDKYRSRFKKSMQRIGADGLYSPHCTRHTFITAAKKNKMDEAALKLIVGHEITDVTEAVYTHRDPSFLLEEICKINYD